MGILSFSDSVAAVLAEAWCEVLGVPEARAEDDFFFLGGGDSHIALAFVEKVESRLDIEFPIESLFVDGTFGALVASCTANARSGEIS
jgi:acyl carrier protein